MPLHGSGIDDDNFIEFSLL